MGAFQFQERPKTQRKRPQFGLTDNVVKASEAVLAPKLRECELRNDDESCKMLTDSLTFAYFPSLRLLSLYLSHSLLAKHDFLRPVSEIKAQNTSKRKAVR